MSIRSKMNKQIKNILGKEKVSPDELFNIKTRANIVNGYKVELQLLNNEFMAYMDIVLDKYGKKSEDNKYIINLNTGEFEERKNKDVNIGVNPNVDTV